MWEKTFTTEGCCRIDVAFSRAKNLLVVVGSRSAFLNAPVPICPVEGRSCSEKVSSGEHERREDMNGVELDLDVHNLFLRRNCVEAGGH
jgi:hypothetical protein